MNPRLHQLYNSLETERAVLIGRLEKLPFEQLNAAPEGKWSVSQILAHIVTGEKLSVQYLSKKILGIHEAKNSGVVEELKMLVLKVSQRIPFKFKAPGGVIEKTPSYSSFNDLIDDWDQVRSELRTLLEKFEDGQIRKKVYRHVRAGLLNVQHALLFFREHIIHHTPQIARLITRKE